MFYLLTVNRLLRNCSLWKTDIGNSGRSGNMTEILAWNNQRIASRLRIFGSFSKHSLKYFKVFVCFFVAVIMGFFNSLDAEQEVTWFFILEVSATLSHWSAHCHQRQQAIMGPKIPLWYLTARWSTSLYPPGARNALNEGRLHRMAQRSITWVTLRLQRLLKGGEGG